VAVGGRAFDVLCTLVAGHERVVGKSELLDGAWPGLVVEENNLSVQISALRKVLGPAAIATVAGRGYQFTLPVKATDAAAARQPAAALHTLAAAPAAPPGPAPERGEPYGLAGLAGVDEPVILAVLAEVAGGVAAATGDDRPGAGAGAPDHWLHHDAADTVRAHGGTVLRPEGGACLAEFMTARAATACTLALQVGARAQRWGTAVCLRMGMAPRARTLAWPAAAAAAWSANAPGHHGASDADRALAIDLARSARPGETRAAAPVRDQVTDALDCQVEDLGDIALRHAAGAVRAYRITPPVSPPPVADLLDDRARLKPLIAVLPFESRQAGGASLAIGELIADGLIAVLSHSRHPWRVVSRLSATAFRGRGQPVSEAQIYLGAAFAISGSYVEGNGRLLVTMQVADCRSGEVAVAHRLDGSVPDLLSRRSDLLDAMLHEIQRAIYQVELQRVQSAPVPTLQSYTLLLGGIQLLHRSTPRDFDLSFRVLEQLAQWHPQASEPRIWQAKWYAMRAVQGQSTDTLADAKAALACTGAALQADPDNAFALAMEGFVHTHLTRDYTVARERLQQAIRQNHSETFAHLFHGVVQGLTGDFAGGLASYEVALSTSPQDPARYLMDTIGAYLYLGCGQLGDAIRLARESLRQNRNHAHTWRTIAIAQQESGALDDARQSMAHIRQLQPDLTVASYLANARPDDAVRHRFAEALRGAGLPAR